VVSADGALLELLRLLKAADYDFTAVTPATHARVLARRCEKPGLREIFGWNRAFHEDDLDRPLLACLRESEMLDEHAGRLRSRVRVASLEGKLFLHSSFPTDVANSVFFGPDTYRFVRAIIPHLKSAAPRWIVDMGAGCGAGAIAAARWAPDARVSAVDVNPLALRFTAINAQPAGVGIETVEAGELPEGADLVIANPPYIMDDGRRAYRDGGGLYGGEVALEWARQALERMARGGTMLLYTGASVVAGEAPLVSELTALGAQIEEIDPDVFGEELDRPAYADVERIAVIFATIRKP
jgi:methylase of polypeptide subunit release factors